jgi:hypothetical protein
MKTKSAWYGYCEKRGIYEEMSKEKATEILKDIPYKHQKIEKFRCIEVEQPVQYIFSPPTEYGALLLPPRIGVKFKLTGPLHRMRKFMKWKRPKKKKWINGQRKIA